MMKVIVFWGVVVMMFFTQCHSQIFSIDQLLTDQQVLKFLHNGDSIESIIDQVSIDDECAYLATDTVIEYVVYLLATFVFSTSVYFLSRSLRECCEARKVFIDTRPDVENQNAPINY